MTFKHLGIVKNFEKQHDSDETNCGVESTVAAPIEKVWECWTKPEHITKWNNASPDWHTALA